MAIILALGLAGFAASIVGSMWVERRKFNRRNNMGVEEHNGFSDYLTNQFIEGGAKALSVLVGIASIGTIFFSLVCIL